MLHHMLRAAAQRAFSTLDPYFKYVTMLLHGDGSALGSDTVTPFNSDASSSARNVTINGDARSNNFNPYQAGYYSNYFSNSYLTTSASAYPSGTGDFTIEGWIFLDNTTANATKTITCGANTNSLGFRVGQSYLGNINGLGLTRYNAADNEYCSYTFSPNTWYHIAVVRSSATIKFYINGTQQTTLGSGIGSYSLASAGTTWIASNTNGDEKFAGSISNLRITNTAVYTSSFTVPTTPLTAISGTSLLTCQSNRFIDNSTNAFTITTSGTPQVSPAQPFTLPSSVATYGSGYFSGTAGSYLETAYNSALDASTGPFTYEAWLNPSTTTNKQYLGGSVTNAFFAFVGSGTIFVGRNNVAVDFTSSALIVTNQWNHVVIVRNSSNNIAIFINGVSAYYNASNTNNYGLASNSLRVGVATTGSSYEYNGYITDVKIAKSALYDPTASTITVPTSPLTAGSAGLLTTQYNGAGNNNGFKDSSQNNFVITRNGNTTQGTFTPYGSNWSNYFNGASYFTSSTSQIIPTGSFTVECLVYVTSTANQAFVAQGTSGNAGRFSLCIESGLWFAQIGSASINTGTPVANTWNYLAVTFNGSTLTLYVNGTSIGTASTGTSAQNTTLAIGTLGASWATTGYFVTGYISNVRVSSVVRTIATPTAPYTSDASTKLLACQSNRFIDSSSNAYVLNLSAGAPSVQRFSPFAPTSAYSTSTIGGSGYFDGTGDYLTGTSPNLSGTWTVELWWYPTALSGNQTIISFNNGAGPGINIWSNSSGQLSVDDGNTGQAAFTTTTFKANQWNHLAVVRNSTTTTGYINGVVAGSNSFTPSTTSAFSIGRFNGGSFQYSNGYISNVRVVNGTAIYTSAFTPPTAPVVATSGTSLLCDMTNAAIYDNAMMNDLETVGNAQISTSVKKYGTGSMYFDGTGDYLDSTGGTVNALGSGDWTIEFWVYFNSLSGTNIIDYRSASVLSNTLAVNYSSGMQLYVNNSTTAIQGSALSTATWYHIAVCKSGSSTKMFVNGTQAGSTYTDTNNYVAGVNRPRIGSGGDVAGNYFNGYIDDLRITKGVARYTANFTPPTAAFPNN